MYSVSGLELLSNMHFGILKLLKFCFASCLGSVAMCIKPFGTVREGKAFVILKESMPQVCSTFLALIEKKFPITG